MGNYGKYTYTYDGTGNCLTRIYESWVSGVWVNNYKYTNTFYVNGNLLTCITESWLGYAWENDSKYTYTYDGNGNCLSYLDETWTSGVWVNSIQNTLTYDVNGNWLTQLTKMWESGAWINNSRSTLTYDGYENCLTQLIDGWINLAWENLVKRTYTYDGNGNSITGKSETWNINNWQSDNNGFLFLYTNHKENNYFAPIYRYEASWSSYDGVLNINPNNNPINLFPNPTTAQLTLEMPTNADGILTISNLSGQELMKQEVANTKTQIDVSRLPSGIYFVKVVNANGVGVKKFVKE